VCGEFIEALQACHQSSWWKRYTGGCNNEERALSMCLRKERVERTQRNAQGAKQRRSEAKEAWKDLESE